MKSGKSASHRRARAVRNVVAIGAEEPSVFAKIETAILREDRELGIMGFTPRKSFLDALNSKQDQFQQKKEKSWVPLVFICTDPPALPLRLVDRTSPEPSLLSTAKDLDKVETLVVVGISSHPQQRANLLECGCTAALTLDETITAIPAKLPAWLRYRK